MEMWRQRAHGCDAQSVVFRLGLALISLGLLIALTANWALGADLIKIDGSSTVYPITEAVAEEYRHVDRSTNITVGISGTGGGFKKFCRGETDISNASRPIKANEVAACTARGISFIEIPVAYDGLAVIVNPKNHWASTMTVAELKTLWEPEAQGTMMKWSQIRAGWPARGPQSLR
jgi:phosphate transport system substrate-binding protein